MVRFIGLLACLFLSIWHQGPAHAVNAPEPATGVRNLQAATAKHFMVSAANPIAAKAGHAILQQGGNAADAAIATQLVLNVVEPQSSGIGGGGFILYYDAASRSMAAYDGRETSPSALKNSDFLDENGKVRPFFELVPGGLSVGTPGLLHAMGQLHKAHGKLPWNQLFEKAIEVAENGFSLSPRLHKTLGYAPHAKTSEGLQGWLAKEGEFQPAGTLVKNPELANTFRTLAKEGIDPFYKGEIAQSMVQAVQHAKQNPGRLSLADLADYESVLRDVICVPYRRYYACAMKAHLAGGVFVLQGLRLLEQFDLAALKPKSVEAIHLLGEVMHHVYADRTAYSGDAENTAQMAEYLLDDAYMTTRAKSIDPAKHHGKVKPGDLPITRYANTQLPSTEAQSTTHLSVRDGKGNVVSMTTSIEYAFGSGVMVGGFLLNNQLTDFTLHAAEHADGQSHPNHVAPYKRPRSAMSPIIILDEHQEPYLVIGSPGGARIIAYVLQAIVNVLDWNMNVQEALAFPHIVGMNRGSLDLEEGTSLASTRKALETYGHTVKMRPLNSGLHAIIINDDALMGGADPRREGIAIGE